MIERTPAAAPFPPLPSRHDEAGTCADPGGVMTPLADSDPTADGFTGHRSAFAEGAVGAPAPFQTKATEPFFVISGALRVLVGEEVTVLNAGDFLAAPPHTPHAFAAAPGHGADVLLVFTPGTGRLDYPRRSAGSCAARRTPRTSPSPRSGSTTTTSTARPDAPPWSRRSGAGFSAAAAAGAGRRPRRSRPRRASAGSGAAPTPRCGRGRPRRARSPAGRSRCPSATG